MTLKDEGLWLPTQDAKRDGNGRKPVSKLRPENFLSLSKGMNFRTQVNIPTFRDAQTGLWAKYSPEELTTPQAFRRNPKLVWEWYAWRRELITQAQPNPGHRALAELERRVSKFTLITQNVDGLHQQAVVATLLSYTATLTAPSVLNRATWLTPGMKPAMRHLAAHHRP